MRATSASRRMLYGGLILLECLLWGLGNPLIKIGGQGIAPFSSIALRFSLAFLAFVLVFGRRVWRGLRGVRPGPCLAVCVFTALSFTLSSLALMYTQANIAGFLMGVAVLFSPFLDPIILRTRFQWRILPVIAVVCVGMYLLCGGSDGFVFGLGEILALLCSLCFAIMLALSEKYVSQVDPIALSTIQCGAAAILCIACMFLFEGGLDLQALSNRKALGAVVYVALGGTCAAYVLQNVAMHHISATFAALAFCTEPVFTALFAHLLLGETLSAQGFVGAGIVLAGVMAASVWPAERSRKA